MTSSIAWRLPEISENGSPVRHGILARLFLAISTPNLLKVLLASLGWVVDGMSGEASHCRAEVSTTQRGGSLWSRIFVRPSWRAVTLTRPPQPTTTFDAFQAESVIFDQLLVSQRALQGGPVTLQERSVAYVSDDRISYAQNGRMRPRRWTYHAGTHLGASDHFPLIATFRVGDGDDNER